MTTVLIEENSLLRVALEHVLMQIPDAGELMVMPACKLHEMTLVPAQPVDLLIMDVQGEAVGAVATLERAQVLFAPRAALALYVVDDALVSAVFAEHGVQGYLSQSSSPQVLAAAIRLVLAGGECYPQREPPVILPRPDAPAAARLTRRQEQILALLVRGRSMREISRQIGVSSATVKSHVRALYWKLNVSSQAEATFAARRLGLLGPGDAEDR